MGQILVGHSQRLQLGRSAQSVSRNMVSFDGWMPQNVALTLVMLWLFGQDRVSLPCFESHALNCISQAATGVTAGTSVQDVVPLQTGVPAHGVLLRFEAFR